MELREIIAEIDALKAQADSLGPLQDDVKERLYQKIRMEWNYHSNSIEGNTLSYGETRSLLLYNLTANGKPLKDHLDMKGHNEALKKLFSIASGELNITENLIKEFHGIILIDPFKEENVDIGKYKKKANYLYNDAGERIDFLAPELVSAKLNELINWTHNALNPPKRKKVEKLHIVDVAAIFHLEFVSIHPFDDGNGRLARIFMNLILMKSGFPPVVVRTEQRDAYSRSIQKAREEGVHFLTIFIAKLLIKSLEEYIEAVKGRPLDSVEDIAVRYPLK